MYKIEIERIEEGFDYTIGKARLYKDNETLFDFYTAEPKGPDCITPNQNRRIPEGSYDTEWVNSTKSGVKIKGKLPVLFNNEVSKDRKILIHVGNNPATDSRGCVLVGLNKGNNKVLESKKCLEMLFDILFEKKFEVEIKNCFNEN